MPGQCSRCCSSARDAHGANAGSCARSAPTILPQARLAQVWSILEASSRCEPLRAGHALLSDPHSDRRLDQDRRLMLSCVTGTDYSVPPFRRPLQRTPRSPSRYVDLVRWPARSLVTHILFATRTPIPFGCLLLQLPDYFEVADSSTCARGTAVVQVTSASTCPSWAVVSISARPLDDRLEISSRVSERRRALHLLVELRTARSRGHGVHAPAAGTATSR